MASIRVATEADGAGVAAVYAPYVRDTAISFESVAPTGETMAERIAQTLLQFPWLVFESGGTMAGFAYASAHRPRAAYRWHADVSVYLDRNVHRRGIGKALYTTLFEILRLQGYYTLYAGITLPNDASEGLHRAMGFRHVATFAREGFKHGHWRDVGWYALELRPCDEEPSEPVPFAAVRDTPEVQELLRNAAVVPRV